jgi:hypothetical protein
MLLTQGTKKWKRFWQDTVLRCWLLMMLIAAQKQNFDMRMAFLFRKNPQETACLKRSS